jgi:hypothetical protein
MLVGERDDEAVELVGFQLLAKRPQAVCISRHGCFLSLPASLNKRPSPGLAANYLPNTCLDTALLSSFGKKPLAATD